MNNPTIPSCVDPNIALASLQGVRAWMGASNISHNPIVTVYLPQLPSGMQDTSGTHVVSFHAPMSKCTNEMLCQLPYFLPTRNYLSFGQITDIQGWQVRIIRLTFMAHVCYPNDQSEWSISSDLAIPNEWNLLRNNPYYGVVGSTT